MFVKTGPEPFLARLDREEAHARRELAEAADAGDRAHWMAALREVAEARRHYGRTRLR